MRAGRLMALLLLLQDRRSSTAAELADALEVSVRTVYRDIAELQGAGVPIWTETGRFGGVRLVDGWRTELDGLTGAEAGALFLAGAPTAVAELGLGAVLAAAQAKVMATLPPELRGRAARVRQRFHLDAPGWFHHDRPLPHLPLVAEAVWSGRRVDVRYGRRDRPVRRRLDPLGLVLKGGIWYLVASHRGQVRTYRVDRIIGATARDEPVDRPAGFELSAWWAQSSRQFDRSILRSYVRIRVSPLGQVLLPRFADAAAAEEALATAGTAESGDHGWVTVDLAVESEEVARSQLMALGDHVEVLAPASLRQSMAELGDAIASRHRRS